MPQAVFSGTIFIRTMELDLFGYMDYRRYLKDRYALEKETKQHFSFRYFARVAGLGSPGFFKMVMEGQRNLTPSSISKFAKAFKFNKKQAAYFEALVLFNQAKSDQERDLYFERLTSLRPMQKMEGLEMDRFEYFTKPHFVILREMMALPHLIQNPAWIGQHLMPPIKAREVEHALGVLLRLGLLRKTEQGEFATSDASLTTPAEVTSLEIYNYHRWMLNEAKESLLRIKPHERDITALTIPIPKRRIAEFKQKIQGFREEMIKEINLGPTDYDEVYQFNCQLFPVTQTKGGVS